MKVKNVLVSNIEDFIDGLKKDLIKNNINYLMVNYNGYYELHMDSIIFRIFQSSLQETNYIDDIYSYIAGKIIENKIKEYENNSLSKNCIYDDESKREHFNISKKKKLKITNNKYKISNNKNINRIRSKKLC